MSSPTLQVFGLCGSLRAQSFNMMALKAAGTLMPAGMTLEIGSFRELPVYDADLQANGFPPAVEALAAKIRQADAVLIASPEYNFSIPGGLKNAIDWVSRLKDQPFNDKPVAILGASGGMLGTARMQYDLRKTMLFLNANVLVKPEVFIGGAAAKFDAQGQLTDEPTRQAIAAQMDALRRWAQRINGSRG